ncbi:MAG TPA: DUF6152 family protein [Bryobacteraceae bacterium]|jgi:hypothetical protein
MKTKLTILASVLAAALPLAAHHSFSAEFDSTKQVTLEGTVVKMDWVNPHSWLYLDVKGPDGQIQHWAVEGGSPNVLLRNGWNRNTLPEGTKIIVHGFMSKDGAYRANSRDIQFPDGRKLDAGSSYTGGKEGGKEDKK